MCCDNSLMMKLYCGHRSTTKMAGSAFILQMKELLLYRVIIVSGCAEFGTRRFVTTAGKT